MPEVTYSDWDGSWKSWDGEGGRHVDTVGAVIAASAYVGVMVVIGTVGATVSATKWLLRRGR